MERNEIEQALAEQGIPEHERASLAEELIAAQDHYWRLEIEDGIVRYRRTGLFEAQLKLRLQAFRDGEANRNKTMKLLVVAATRDACPECGSAVEPDLAKQEGRAKNRIEHAICIVCGIPLVRATDQRWRRE
jgi:hypothetical protein